MKRNILLIEDELSMRLGVSHSLSGHGYEVTACEDGIEGLKAIQQHNFDLIITDFRLPGMSGMEILTESMKICPDTGVIIITGFPEVDTAVSAIKKGAFDYLSKPFSNDTLLIVVDRYFRYRQLQLENDQLRETVREKSQSEEFIGESSAIKAVFDRLATVAPTDVPVRIQGESGTGKELVASALHRLSLRKDKTFLKINCAAIPEDLLESELFGYEKGAFTGAVQSKKGKFEVADGGTIFFDEIGEMPITLQAKLLRVLEEHELTRLGSNTSIKIDVRTIFATAKDLKKAISERTFREDLFYRINVVPIHLPPLRERGEDITALAEHFLKIYSTKYRKKGLDISPDAYKRLLAYDYPGNVRELKNAIERAVLLSTGSHIYVTHLPSECRGGAKIFLVLPKTCLWMRGLNVTNDRESLRLLMRRTEKKLQLPTNLVSAERFFGKNLRIWVSSVRLYCSTRLRCSFSRYDR
ncbi:CheY-like receiver, AAA-type ATPase and DNA-binding domain-containing response regulator [Desulfocapsa sulfexigens DSM 10523]|uniref:CheY-like receiver, AAA-type ATPase and DNA-binding domain-containing response regulator n=1 Tax=Desulfocapsa sulfexigens (strain DSM 10523 / SB164P1) TaxID=1167006 RepID=M1PIX1_DESSD|nr:sigma-54 dependent transcriptional regulator [Desulfocapsa sulfexigens]AGF79515.1 CheY-like receiver, AAA-type ATPase and DNA-binding domain-containing response regulator [Desulfocapsa sulfexigens DSM 10523]